MREEPKDTCPVCGVHMLIPYNGGRVPPPPTSPPPGYSFAAGAYKHETSGIQCHRVAARLKIAREKLKRVPFSKDWEEVWAMAKKANPAIQLVAFLNDEKPVVGGRAIETHQLWASAHFADLLRLLTESGVSPSNAAGKTKIATCLAAGDVLEPEEVDATIVEFYFQQELDQNEVVGK